MLSLAFRRMAIRRPAPWMQAVDERILEYLDTEGGGSPTSIVEDGEFDYHANTVGRRLRLLLETELVERIARGQYRITPKGRAFLAGQEDLRDVEEPE